MAREILIITSCLACSAPGAYFASCGFGLDAILGLARPQSPGAAMFESTNMTKKCE
jgi:hypothetical protein